jgi:hypothetical protein
MAILSCSQSEPVISYGSLQLVIFENGGTPAERLSFFVLPQDGDGMEDLDELWLYHDWDGLSWHLKREDWIEETLEGKTWVGSRAIAMTDNSSLPRGQYRAVLVDKGGARSEKLLAFDAPVSAGRGPRAFPVLTINGTAYRIISEYPAQKLLAYDNEGNYIGGINPPSLEGELAALELPPQARSLALWSIDTEHSVSAITDVVPLGD